MWIHVRNSSLSRFHERFHFKANCCEFLVFAATIRNSATDVARFNQRPTAWQLTASSTTFKFRASCSGPDVINVMGIIFLNIPVAPPLRRFQKRRYLRNTYPNIVSSRWNYKMVEREFYSYSSINCRFSLRITRIFLFFFSFSF